MIIGSCFDGIPGAKLGFIELYKPKHNNAAAAARKIQRTYLDFLTEFPSFRLEFFEDNKKNLCDYARF
jgi:hypothetical protein